MSSIDQLMLDEFMPFYKRVLAAFKQNHHTLFAMISTFVSGKKSRIGIQLTEDGKPLGQYTLVLEGASISHLEAGSLESEVHTPFGIIRPYLIFEKSIIREILNDEHNFISNPFATKMKYMHDTTIKFLQS